MKKLAICFLFTALSFSSIARQVLAEEELLGYALEHYRLFDRQQFELQASEFRQKEAWKLPPAEFNGQYGQLNSDTFDPLIEIRQSLGVPLEMIRKKQRLMEESHLLVLEQDLEKKEYLAALRNLYAQWAYYFSLDQLYTEREAELLAFEKVAALRKELGESGGSELLLAQSQGIQLKAERSKNAARIQGLAALIEAQSGFDMAGYVPADQERELMNRLSVLLKRTTQEHPALFIEQQKVTVWEQKERELRAAISPGFFAGYFRQRITDPTTVFEGLQGFQLGIQFPVLSGSYKASVKAASAMRNGAELQAQMLDKQLLARQQQIKQDLMALQESLLSYQQEVLPRQKQLQEMALKQFEQGSVSYVEYVQIQALRFEAEQQYRAMLLETAQNISQFYLYLPENQ